MLVLHGAQQTWVPGSGEHLLVAATYRLGERLVAQGARRQLLQVLLVRVDPLLLSLALRRPQILALRRSGTSVRSHGCSAMGEGSYCQRCALGKSSSVSKLTRPWRNEK